MAADIATPTLVPPAARTVGNGGLGTSVPDRMPPAAASGAADVIGRQIPVLRPPAGLGATTAGAAAATTVTGTWFTGATVDALWCADEIRNAWMHLPDTGWKKIFNGSDGAFTALATLAAQARQTGHQVNYRQEADGMVHEIYLW